jgi:hypothetical protein
MTAFRDLAGQTFGDLTVLYSIKNDKHGPVRFC